jgi:hypothetical protein
MSKQQLVHAIAGLLETSPSHTDDIAIYGQRITQILSGYDFTLVDSLAAAEALANALSIEDEEEDEEEVGKGPAIVDASADALMVFCAHAYTQNPVPTRVIKEFPRMKLIEASASDLFL